MLKSLLYLSLFIGFFFSCSSNNNHREETRDERFIAIEEIDTAIIHSMEEVILNNEYPNIHSVLIAHNNKLIYENYWSGQDESWGDKLGNIKHGKDDLHDIRSISKSIVSACVGIAIEQGKIKSVDQKVFEFFPEFKKQDTGLKSALTIKHLLTMTSGLKWNEDIPYDNPENSEIQMIRAPDAVGYVLSQPMDFSAGKIWKYNGGTTQLLAAILQKTTGKRIDSFANEFLFQPLGVPSFEWAKYPGTELPAAASGLRLRSKDLLNFGLLYMNGGQWNNKQIIPALWIADSHTSHTTTDKGGGYGYQFWLWTDTIMHKPVPFVVCVGNGDQRVFMNKEIGLVVVITAGNYNKWDIRKNAGALLKDFIYPAVFKRTK